MGAAASLEGLDMHGPDLPPNLSAENTKALQSLPEAAKTELLDALSTLHKEKDILEMRLKSLRNAASLEVNEADILKTRLKGMRTAAREDELHKEHLQIRLKSLTKSVSTGEMPPPVSRVRIAR
jgi:hypothetical protein|eukprot:1807457-Prymnesium_polylepis.1